MATAVQRYLFNLFNLETNISRNDKLLKLNLRDMCRIHDHIKDNKRWISCKRKGLFQRYYNPELDVEFKVTYKQRPDDDGKLVPAMIISERDHLNNRVRDVLEYSWDYGQ